jgi:hypothetical protein
MMESLSSEGRFARGAREYRDALNGLIILHLPGILLGRKRLYESGGSSGVDMESLRSERRFANLETH